VTATLPRRLAAGALAGILAGLAFTVVSLLLRLVAGVPLMAELVGDRLIPMLNVHTFVRLLGRVGGPLTGKALGFTLSLIAQVVAGLVIGLLYGAIYRQGQKSRDGADPGHGHASVAARVRTRAWAILAAAGLLAWLVAVLLLWPVLASNYVGLSFPWDRTVSAIGLGVAIGVFVAVLPPAYRALAPRRSSDVPESVSDKGTEPPREAAPADVNRIRRRTIILGGLAVLVGAVAAGIADALYRRATFGANGYDGLSVRGPRTSPITPNDEFYCVTKNLIDPRVDASLWRLRVIGMVERPAALTYGDLRALPQSRQLQTLECISNRVGAGLMSNAEWTGVPLRSLIEAARPDPAARRVAMHAADGYVHTVSLDKALEPTTIVAYLMNGQALPDRHGYPARVLVPGTYGEVSVKWVNAIELTDEPVEGYYERQGWRPYLVQTTSRFDRPMTGQSIALADTPTVPIGGVAFAGDRGISAVEWSDGGRTWRSARITYAPTKLTWALWDATWTPPRTGTFMLVVRATDGEGHVQPSTEHGAVPAGASGWHRVRVTVT
jgi:DMSO/TMAO reductase YedYZ molybdopterin-dependent catalytic subunit